MFDFFVKDPVQLHQKFIDECYNRLELAMIPIGGSAVAQALSIASTILAGISVPEAAAAPSPSRFVCSQFNLTCLSCLIK
jgi:hypothetical protein